MYTLKHSQEKKKTLIFYIKGSHTYCQSCLNQLVDLAGDTNEPIDRIKITCPECLTEHTLDSKASIEDAFPRNLALQQMLEIRPTHMISDTYCESCASEFAFSNCIHCDQVVCFECKNKHKVELIGDLNTNTHILRKNCKSFICKLKI